MLLTHSLTDNLKARDASASKNVNPPLAIIPYPMTYGEVQLLKHMHQILDLELLFFFERGVIYLAAQIGRDDIES